jgi:hypothetical protein
LCPSKFFPSENVIRRLLKQLTITSSEWSGRSRQPMRPTCWPVMWGEKCTGLLQQLPLLTKGSKTIPSQASFHPYVSRQLFFPHRARHFVHSHRLQRLVVARDRRLFQPRRFPE